MADDSPISQGVAGRLTPQPGARLSKTTEFGFDKVSRPFKCLTSEAQRLMPAEFSGDTIYSGFYLTDYEIEDGEGLLSDMNLVFTGLLKSNTPKPRYKNNYCLQSVSAHVTVPGSGVEAQVEFQYRAPSTTWKWIEKSKPADTPRYSTLATGMHALNVDNIIAYSGTDNQNNPLQLDYAGFVAAWNSLVEITTTVEYDPEEVVPGFYWQCTATIARTLRGS